MVVEVRFLADAVAVAVALESTTPHAQRAFQRSHPMRTKRLIQAAKLALVFLFVGCSSSGDGSTTTGQTAELGVGTQTDHTGQGGCAGHGAAMATTELPTSHPGAGGADASDATPQTPGAGGKSGSGGCIFFGSIFKCPGKGSTPSPGSSSSGTAGHTGSGGRNGGGTPETGAGTGGSSGHATIPWIL